MIELTCCDEAFEANGLRLHYLDWGPADGPPVVLLHGLTSHAHSWDHFASELSGSHRVIALDQRGHGDSQWSADGEYATADYVSDTLALVDALGLDRFDLVGLSMGAHNSMGFAAAHGDRVKKLVPVDIAPALRRPGATPTPGAPPLQAPQRVFDSIDEAFKASREQNSRPPEDVQRHRVEWSLKLRDDGKYELKYDPQAPGKWRPADLWEAIAGIGQQTLIIRGAQSLVLSPENAEKMVATFPDARLVTVDGAGHPVPLDRPEDFARTVTEFLAD